MPTLTARFFGWAANVARENEEARCVSASPRKIAGFDVDDKKVLIGNVRQVCNGFGPFLEEVCQKVFDRAGPNNSGVEIDSKSALAACKTVKEFLSVGHSSLPAIAWVAPVTCSLAAHTGGNACCTAEGIHFDIDPVRGKLLVPLRGIPHKRKPSFEINPGEFRWFLPEDSKLALIPRMYQGNGFDGWRKQFTFASFANSDLHRHFLQENDLVLAHDGAIIKSDNGKAGHSCHPLICCGRLREYPNDIEQSRSHPTRAIFDYVAIVFDAWSRGLVSFSYLIVDFEHWVKFWSDVGESVWSVVAPGEVKSGLERREEARTVKALRHFILEEICDWQSIYIRSTQMCSNIETAAKDTMMVVGKMGWQPPVCDEDVMDRTRRFVRTLQSFETFVKTLDLNDDLHLARCLRDIATKMDERRNAFGF